MRTAVITGGSRGIGRAIAYKFAENGYAVAVIYKCSKKKAGELCLEIRRISVLRSRISKPSWERSQY